MHDKVKYTCKNCGWETSIRAEWADIKPKRCMNKKCNTSFLGKPDDLLIKRPEKKAAPKPEKKVAERKTSHKQKGSRKTFKHQSKKEEN